MNSPALVLLIAYLLGSIPFGYLIVKAGDGDDIRGSRQREYRRGKCGSQCRTRSRRVDSVLDAAKGYAAVLIAERWTHGTNSTRWMMAAAIAAVVGHMFSVWLGFQGGKGVATGFGVFIADLPRSGVQPP